MNRESFLLFNTESCKCHGILKAIWPWPLVLPWHVVQYVHDAYTTVMPGEKKYGNTVQFARWTRLVITQEPATIVCMWIGQGKGREGGQYQDPSFWQRHTHLWFKDLNKLIAFLCKTSSCLQSSNYFAQCTVQLKGLYVLIKINLPWFCFKTMKFTIY